MAIKLWLDRAIAPNALAVPVSPKVSPSLSQVIGDTVICTFVLQPTPNTLWSWARVSWYERMGTIMFLNHTKDIFLEV